MGQTQVVDGRVLVETPRGRLRGAREDDITVFRGIRYAQPPTGPLRFRAPQPVEPWSGVRDALAFAPICPQHPSEGIMARAAPPQVQDEDCLALNIWTPDTDGGKRAVMVWIHGGAYVIGSGSDALYTGETFAAKDVVYVSLNYRLHVLGFLDLEGAAPGFETSSNNGVADLVAGLTWVRDNIAAFGGDPDNVTIFGESAGGGLVGALLGTPSARGLFRRAICQSGTGHHTRSRAVAKRATAHFCKSLGVAVADVAALQAAPIEQIMATFEAYGMGGSRAIADEIFQGEDPLGSMPFRMTHGDEVIPGPPMEAIAAGSAKGVDLIVGANDDEFRLFYVAAQGRAGSMLPFETFAERLGVSVDDLKRAYREGAPEMSDDDVQIQLSSDLWFILPGRDLAQVQAGLNPRTYRYAFGWKSPAFGGALGASHGLDIPFVFDHLTLMAPLLGNNPPRALAQAMQDAWIAFARTGEPGWAAWRDDHRKVMRFNDAPTVVDDPEGARARIWKPLFSGMGLQA